MAKGFMFKSEKNYERLNHLPSEVKVLVVQVQGLIEGVREGMHQMGIDLSLPYKLQLRSDCSDLERQIRGLNRFTVKQKKVDKLRLSAFRLQVVAKNLLGWEYAADFNVKLEEDEEI